MKQIIPLITSIQEAEPIPVCLSPPPPFSVSIFCLIAVVQKVVENEGGRESSTAETDLLVCLLKIQIRILPPPTQLCFGRVK